MYYFNIPYLSTFNKMNDGIRENFKETLKQYLKYSKLNMNLNLNNIEKKNKRYELKY